MSRTQLDVNDILLQVGSCCVSFKGAQLMALPHQQWRMLTHGPFGAAHKTFTQSSTYVKFAIRFLISANPMQYLCNIKICGRLKCDIPVNRDFLSSEKCKFAKKLQHSQIWSQTWHMWKVLWWFCKPHKGVFVSSDTYITSPSLWLCYNYEAVMKQSYLIWSLQSSHVSQESLRKRFQLCNKPC